jgi:hypothetical protein
LVGTRLNLVLPIKKRLIKAQSIVSMRKAKSKNTENFTIKWMLKLKERLSLPLKKNLMMDMTKLRKAGKNNGFHTLWIQEAFMWETHLRQLFQYK